MVIPHETCREYLFQVNPAVSCDHVVVHDIDDIVPVNEVVADGLGKSCQGDEEKKEDLPVHQFLLLNRLSLFYSHLESDNLGKRQLTALNVVSGMSSKKALPSVRIFL